MLIFRWPFGKFTLSYWNFMSYIYILLLVMYWENTTHLESLNGICKSSSQEDITGDEEGCLKCYVPQHTAPVCHSKWWPQVLGLITFPHTLVHGLVSRSSQPLTMAAGRKLCWLQLCLSHSQPGKPSLRPYPHRLPQVSFPPGGWALWIWLPSAAREPSKAVLFLALSAGWEKSFKRSITDPSIIYAKSAHILM